MDLFALNMEIFLCDDNGGSNFVEIGLQRRAEQDFHRA